MRIQRAASNGLSTTQTLTINVLPAVLPPVIATQPAGRAVDQGQSTTLTVTTSGGTAPFSYQWRLNGVAIPSATSSVLSLVNIQQASAGTYSVTVTNAAGSVTSNNAVVTVNTVPTLAFQPRTQIALVGSTVTFSVVANGGVSFNYQWRKNGVAIVGANSSTLTLTGVTAADAGNYDVKVTNNLGDVTSSLAQLTVVTSAVVPVVTSQPASQTALVGASVTLSVSASGVPAPSYQWRKNGVAIPGANNTLYVFGNVLPTDAGNYDVVISNSAGAVTTAVAGLKVFTRSYAGIYFGSFGSITGNFAIYVRNDNTGVFLGYLPASAAPMMSLNLSVNDGGQFTFTQGAIAAAAASDLGEPARAAALAQVNVSGILGADGTVTGSVTGGTIASFSGNRSSDTGVTQGVAGFYRAGAASSGATAYTITSAAGQAFVVTQTGATSDGGIGAVNSAGQVLVTTPRSSITETIAPGAGTLAGTVSGAASASFAGGSDAAVASQRLVNISSRARVGTLDSLEIAGFVISGEESKPVLIRAVGPTLASFGVAGALASPKLDLYRGSTVVATNTGVAASPNAAAIAAAAVQAGAFALGTSGADSAILITLAPGNYTAQVSSATTATGIALVEVYDLSAAAPGQKLLNISTRASAGASDSTLIAGFVIPAGPAKRVLVRGVGPGLTTFGVQGVLAQPTLTLLNGAAVVAQNTNWTTSADSAAITAASAQVGAFGLATGDSAMIVTLAPGNYTAQITGAGTSTGIALIEVYEVP